ncbi:MAG: T9SS type A sorting domain-containing protein [Bacteroidetes bacterium]|nr:MAG: T9SS type A sorting domain-containing protein [Bacteroidota bacterium]
MWKFYAKRPTITSVFLFFISIALFAQDPHLTVTPVLTGLGTPVQVTNAGDGSNRIFVVMQGASTSASIFVYNSSFVKLDTFLTVTGISTGGERGLLSMAFHPQYGNISSPFHGLFYVYYTNAAGDLEISRYQVSNNPDSADENTRAIVLTIPHPVNANHNGGTIRFGPDGYLYLATGDGGSGGDPPNNAQNPNVLLGKMLRLDVNSSSSPPYYSSPASNPYFGVTTPDTLDQIYAFGLRNPFRYSFDRLNGNLWIGDVGQGTREEIDFRPADSTAGVNYGWRCYEGNLPYSPGGCGPIESYQFPIFDYPNPGGAAVTGGVVYRGTLPVNAPLAGFYVATDYYSGTFYKIRPDGAGGWTVYSQAGLLTGVPSIGETESGEILLVSQFSGGRVMSVTVDAVLPARMTEFTARLVNGNTQLTWRTSFEENLSRFEIEHSKDGVIFNTIGVVNATNNPNGAVYSFTHTLVNSGKQFYRLKMINLDNSSELSGIASVETGGKDRNFVRPSIITSGVINVFLDDSYNTVEVVSMKGEILAKQNINGRTGRVDIPVGAIPAGTYIVQLRNRESTAQQKVIIR